MRQPIDTYYDAENKERPSKHIWERNERIIAIGGLFAILAYVIITGCTLNEIRRQANAAYRQLELMQYSQRPWVGIDGNINIKQPIFQVSSANSKPSTAVEFDAVVQIKKFGLSPAFRTAFFMTARITANSVTALQDMMQTACTVATGRSERGEGSVLFPGNDLTAEPGGMVGEGIRLADIRRVWLMGCIAYWENGLKIHHTKILVRSFIIPENTVPVVVEQGPSFSRFSIAISGWTIEKIEAD